MTSLPVLAFLNSDEPFVVEMDRFSVATGVVLGEMNGIYKVDNIRFAYRRMTPAKLKNITSKREVHAVIFA